METHLISKNQPSRGNFSEIKPENKKCVSHSFATVPQNKLQMIDASFHNWNSYTDKKIRCLIREADISSVGPTLSHCDHYRWVQWSNTSLISRWGGQQQASPLTASIVSRDLALAEIHEMKSVAVCRRNGASVTSLVIPATSDELKWAWVASQRGDLLVALNDVNSFDENRSTQPAVLTNIEVYDIPGERLVPIKLSSINSDDSQFGLSKMSMSPDGNMLLGAVDQGLTETLKVWTKQNVQEGDNFVFQSDARFDHGSSLEKLNCDGHAERKCLPVIRKLACSDDKNKVAIGWGCQLSLNLFITIIAELIPEHCAFVGSDLLSRGSFKHMLFSQSGTWLAFFCESRESMMEECKNPATLLRLDGAAIELTYDILGKGGYDDPCFSSDSSLFAYTTLGQAKVINLRNLRQVDSDLQSNTFGLNDKSVTSLDFSPLREKNTLIVVSESKINFWEFKAQPTLVGVLNLAPHALFQQAVFSSNGLGVMALDEAKENIYLLTPRNVEGKDDPSAEAFPHFY